MPDVARMSLTDRLEVVVRRAAALVPGDAGRRLAELVSPEALAIMAGVVAVWAASHFVGVGEIADVALLVGGWLTIGAGAVAGCRKLLSFGLGTYNARTKADLERAAKDLAEAVGILGVDVALGLLFKGRPKGTFGNSYKGALPPICRAFAADAARRTAAPLRVPDHLHARQIRRPGRHHAHQRGPDRQGSRWTIRGRRRPRHA